MINKHVARAIDPGAFADWADARDPRAAGEQARRQADAYETAERVLAVLPAPPVRKFVYCPIHGDLLAYGDRRSARCLEAEPGHELGISVPPVVDESKVRERIAQEILTEVEKDLHSDEIGDNGMYRVGLRCAADIARGTFRG